MVKTTGPVDMSEEAYLNAKITNNQIKFKYSGSVNDIMEMIVNTAAEVIVNMERDEEESISNLSEWIREITKERRKNNANNS